mmetsp:Transcript_2522/g.7470  ORF Transcript_2522/g.7470 Transcript_2522/m.7470 type:complete len:207 (-) Transcript_2522:1641-2261(-)
MRFTAMALFAMLDTAVTRRCIERVVSRREAQCPSMVKVPWRFASHCSAQISYTVPIARSKRGPNETRAKSLASFDASDVKPSSSRPITHRSKRSHNCAAHRTSRWCCALFIFQSFFGSRARLISRPRDSPMTSLAPCFSNSRCMSFAMWLVCVARYSFPMYFSNCSAPKSMPKKTAGSMVGRDPSVTAAFPMRSYRSRSLSSLRTW